MKARTFTDDQILALVNFAHTEGRNWKFELSTYWLNGNYPYHCRDYSHLLQQARNTGGPRALQALRIKGL